VTRRIAIDVIEDEATHRLGEALNHLHAFAATFSPDDYVDEQSALTADDLNVILELLEKLHAIAKAAPKPR
jgi:hypothetical protein